MSTRDCSRGPFERRRLTVAELEARLADEAAARRRLGFVKLTIVPDVEGFRRDVRDAIEAMA